MRESSTRAFKNIRLHEHQNTKILRQQLTTPKATYRQPVHPKNFTKLLGSQPLGSGTMCTLSA